PPYVFLVKMAKGTPALPPCAEQKLARFVREQPENALANYYYGVALEARPRIRECGRLAASRNAVRKSGEHRSPTWRGLSTTGDFAFRAGRFPAGDSRLQEGDRGEPAT